MPVRLSVILAVANQGDHIGGTVDGYLGVLRAIGQEFEIILVVNRTTDNSLAVCRALGAANREVTAIESRPGWGAAVRAGIAAASGSVLCYTNSARTSSEDLDLALRYALVSENVIVKASRKLRGSVLRRIGSVIYNFEARSLYGLAVWDVNGTPKVFSRQMLPRLGLSEDGDLIDLEFVVNAQRNRLPILEMPVYATDRQGGTSTTNLVSALKMYWGAVALRNRLRTQRVEKRAGPQPDL
jgi:glycosyltransferase involved in cell wall biosynthesis